MHDTIEGVNLSEAHFFSSKAECGLLFPGNEKKAPRQRFSNVACKI